MKTAINFFKEAYRELQRSTWLSRREVVQSTILVFIVCALVSAYIVVIDSSLAWAVGKILSRGAA
ncbi:preprotein translocase subunit SecE [Parelusimicrobium proximum]|uniref:preprotein translocase subunit SecE n=1 Tax=Parelusimicrobium proximum TaxID=3228953 RepID=UPI003D17A59E